MTARRMTARLPERMGVSRVRAAPESTGGTSPYQE